MSHTFYPADQTEIMRTALDLYREIKGDKSPPKIVKRSWELGGFVAGLSLGDPDVSGARACRDDEECLCDDAEVCLCDDAEVCREFEKIAAELGVMAEPVNYFQSVALGPQKAKLKLPWLKNVAVALLKLAIDYAPTILPLVIPFILEPGPKSAKQDKK